VRVAIISDIHGNLEAFKSVLADMETVDVAGVACLGDNVGYGPEPEAVVNLIRNREIPCVMGNHELVLTKADRLSNMNPMARKSALMTRDLISSDTMDYMRRLKPSMHFHGALCVHGCPPASITKYLILLSREELIAVFRSMADRICFAGHTHELAFISFDGEEVFRDPLGRAERVFRKDRQYIVNVGSVGQPRDGDNRAKYVIWNLSRHTVHARFVPYDIGKTARKILALGLPEFNASRLW
jgi:diadenosine tetraphosphatase ApaH/serine/threonine PP2A family protein phosphatase